MSRAWCVKPGPRVLIHPGLCVSPGLTPLLKGAWYKFFFFQPLLSSMKAGGKNILLHSTKEKTEAYRGKWLTQVQRWSQRLSWEWSSILWLWNHSPPWAVTPFLRRKLSAHAWRYGLCTWQVPLGLESGTLCLQSSHSNPWNYCFGLQIRISWYSPLKELSKALSKAKHMTLQVWENKSS